jgi:uncharacterized membrane protein YcgQ (UPF0703/DUF1980 family)
MKQVLVIVIIISLLITSGCGASAPEQGQVDGFELTESTQEVVEIKDNLFIQQCNDIYLNYDSYADKQIKISGMAEVYGEPGMTTCYSVYRIAPGCCGYDGWAGFDFEYDGDLLIEPNDWITVTADVIPNDYGDGSYYVTLKATDVVIEQERGLEFVTT